MIGIFHQCWKTLSHQLSENCLYFAPSVVHCGTNLTSMSLLWFPVSFFFLYSPEDIFHCFERKRDRAIIDEREKYWLVAFSHAPRPEIVPTTWVCALTGIEPATFHFEGWHPTESHRLGLSHLLWIYSFISLDNYICIGTLLLPGPQKPWAILKTACADALGAHWGKGRSEFSDSGNLIWNDCGVRIWPIQNLRLRIQFEIEAVTFVLKCPWEIHGEHYEIWNPGPLPRSGSPALSFFKSFPGDLTIQLA